MGVTKKSEVLVCFSTFLCAGPKIARLAKRPKVAVGGCNNNHTLPRVWVQAQPAAGAGLCKPCLHNGGWVDVEAEGAGWDIRFSQAFH